MNLKERKVGWTEDLHCLQLFLYKGLLSTASSKQKAHHPTLHRIHSHLNQPWQSSDHPFFIYMKHKASRYYSHVKASQRLLAGQRAVASLQGPPWRDMVTFSTAHLGVLEPQGIQVIHIYLPGASPHLGHHLPHKTGGQQLELPHRGALWHPGQLVEEWQDLQTLGTLELQENFQLRNTVNSQRLSSHPQEELTTNPSPLFSSSSPFGSVHGERQVRSRTREVRNPHPWGISQSRSTWP